MKHGLKFCAAVLAFALICMGGLILSAKAEIVSSGACGADGDNLTWTLDDRGVLTISGTGHMQDYYPPLPPGLVVEGDHRVTAPWGTGIKGAIIENGVTSIGESAFDSCEALTSVTIPNSVTSIKVQAFAGCVSLASVTIPNGVTSISSYAFAGCEGLTSVTIPAGTEAIDYGAFSHCTNLCSVTILNPDAAIGGEGFDVFEDCAAGLTLHGWAGSTAQTYAGGAGHAFAPLAACGDNVYWMLDNDSGELTITGTGPMADFSQEGPPWYEQREAVRTVTIENGVTNIGNFAFWECVGLTTAAIADSVTVIKGGAFGYCTSLTAIEIPGSVASIDMSAFEGCSSLSSVTIQEGVTSIGMYAFVDCTGLTSMTLPASVASIGDDAFYYCTALTSVTILHHRCDIGYSVFRNCSPSLTLRGYTGSTAEAYAAAEGITFDSLGFFTRSGSCGDDVSWTFYSATGALAISGTGDMWDFDFDEAPWYQLQTDIKTVEIGEGVTSIGCSAFSDYTDLTGVTIPASVTYIGWDAFNGCTGLTSVTIPAGVICIGDCAFRGCTGLTSVEIPAGVTDIGECAFYECSGLTGVTIPASVAEIGWSAFHGCTGMTSVTISHGVAIIDMGVFSICTGLTSVEIPASVTNVGDIAFYGCTGLTSVTILNPSCVIGDEDLDVFTNCASLVLRGYTGSTAETYAAAANIPFEAIEIPAPTFILPTSLKSIPEAAFSGIAAKAVQIPASVTSITGNPFAGSAVLFIYGAPGTKAETFAAEYGYTFVPVAD